MLDPESRDPGQVHLSRRDLVTAFRILAMNRSQKPKGILGDCGASAVTTSAGSAGPGIELCSRAFEVPSAGCTGPGIGPRLCAFDTSLVSPWLTSGPRCGGSTCSRVWKEVTGGDIAAAWVRQSNGIAVSTRIWRLS